MSAEPQDATKRTDTRHDLEELAPAAAVPGSHREVDGIAEWFRSKREALGLSQKELAEQCGMTQSTISKIESGSYQKSSTLRKIASQLGFKMIITFQ